MQRDDRLQEFCDRIGPLADEIQSSALPSDQRLREIEVKIFDIVEDVINTPAHCYEALIDKARISIWILAPETQQGRLMHSLVQDFSNLVMCEGSHYPNAGPKHETL